MSNGLFFLLDLSSASLLGVCSQVVSPSYIFYTRNLAQLAEVKWVSILTRCIVQHLGLLYHLLGDLSLSQGYLCFHSIYPQGCNGAIIPTICLVGFEDYDVYKPPTYNPPPPPSNSSVVDCVSIYYSALEYTMRFSTGSGVIGGRCLTSC